MSSLTDAADGRDATILTDRHRSRRGVNLVTRGEHGHPETYLYDELAAAFDDRDLAWEYVDQCGCGGHVTRVRVEE